MVPCSKWDHSLAEEVPADGYVNGCDVGMNNLFSLWLVYDEHYLKCVYLPNSYELPKIF